MCFVNYVRVSVDVCSEKKSSAKNEMPNPCEPMKNSKRILDKRIERKEFSPLFITKTWWSISKWSGVVFFSVETS